jgi:hypothetical protein
MLRSKVSVTGMSGTGKSSALNARRPLDEVVNALVPISAGGERRSRCQATVPHHADVPHLGTEVGFEHP